MNPALSTLKEKRYPGGMAHCASAIKTQASRVTGRPAYACDYCGSDDFPDGRDDLREEAALHSRKVHAMYLMGSTRAGSAQRQIQRECGVTYKTAWRMFKQIRSLLSEPDMQLEGSNGRDR